MLTARQFYLLREDARRWWYHRQLREQRNFEEARKREHASIRSRIRDIRTMRRAGGMALKTPRGGTRLSIDGNSTASGCHPYMFPCVKEFGVLCVEFSDDYEPWGIVKMPIPKPGAPELESYGPMDYCPPLVWAEMAHKMGAAVFNHPNL